MRQRVMVVILCVCVCLLVCPSVTTFSAILFISMLMISFAPDFYKCDFFCEKVSFISYGIIYLLRRRPVLLQRASA